LIRIIVFGVSGVGKTTACREYVARNPEFVHVTASQLIRNVTGATLEELRRADAAQIICNQKVLQEALRSELQRQNATKVIVDGQCVLDNGREIVVLPVDLVAPLHPTGFVLLEGQPDDVFRRRLQDSRERPFRTAEELLSQTAMNRKVVHGYADILKVPLVVASAGENFSLTPAVTSLISLDKNP
jgi:adenylate kinase